MMHWVFLGAGGLAVTAIFYHLVQVGQGEHNHIQKPMAHALGALVALAQAAFFILYALSLLEAQKP